MRHELDSTPKLAAARRRQRNKVPPNSATNPRHAPSLDGVSTVSSAYRTMDKSSTSCHAASPNAPYCRARRVATFTTATISAHTLRTPATAARTMLTL